MGASHGVHPNMRGHTGGGLTISNLTKQKLNTRSSTETKIVGVDGYMLGVLWTRLFLEARDYGVKENIVFQDNKTAMLLENNGKASSGERTKHINMRNFFITDQIYKGQVKVVWCPTGDMTADFYTKPLQGAMFRNFREKIMGVVSQPDPVPGKKMDRKKSLDNIG